MNIGINFSTYLYKMGIDQLTPKRLLENITSIATVAGAALIALRLLNPSERSDKNASKEQINTIEKTNEQISVRRDTVKMEAEISDYKNHTSGFGAYSQANKFQPFWVMVQNISKINAVWPESINKQLQVCWQTLSEKDKDKALDILNKQKIEVRSFMQ